MNAVMFERGLYLLTETDDIYSELEKILWFQYELQEN